MLYNIGPKAVRKHITFKKKSVQQIKGTHEFPIQYKMRFFNAVKDRIAVKQK